MIDQIIDTVAREMTEADPPPDFRARVIAALPPTQRPRWRRFAIPAAAVGMLALAVLLNGVAGPTGPEGPKVQGSKGPTDLTIGATVDSVRPSVAASAGPLDPWTLGPLGPVEDPAWRARAVEPLPVLTPMSIEPIQPIGLSIAPITVTPIVTEPLLLPMLDSRSGRD